MNFYLRMNCLLLMAWAAFAQDAGLNGTVLDAVGRPVPSARVLVKNEQTGINRETNTTEAGVFGVNGLAPGAYAVTLNKDGFDSIERKGLILNVGAQLRLDMKLDVSANKQTINIVEAVPLVDADSPSLATEVSSRQYDQLPLVQQGRIRSPAAFVYLAPSVQGGLAMTGRENTSATNFIQVNGSQTLTTELYLNGVQAGRSRPRAAGSFNENAPAVDAIQEFRFISSLLPADYGKTGAAVGILSMKTGTNKLHGSVYEYLRNNILDAQPWGATQALFTRQNEFGATFGGPVVLPKLYNGRNRTFFFFSYGGSRKRGVDSLNLVRVATPEQIQGNFAGQPLIYDPATTAPDSTGRLTRSAFPNNVIPRNRLDPVAQAIAKFYPAPNTAGTRNFSGFIGEKLLDIDAEAARVDHQINQRNQLSASFVFTYIPRIVVQSPLPAPLIGGQNQPARTNTGQLHWTLTPSARSLNRLSVALNRYVSPSAPIDNDAIAPAVIGLKGITSSAPPTIIFGNGYVTTAQNALQYQVENTYILRDVAYLTLGAQQLRFGGEYRVSQYNDYTPTPTSSSLGFSNLETALPTSAASTGDSFASFLLGQVSTAALNLPLGVSNRQKYFGFFLQDDWKLSSRFTLNLGIRWEMQLSPYEKVGRYSIVDLTAPNPGAGNRLGAVAFAGKSSTGSPFGDKDASAFGPRIGFAYRLTPKTVLRGGYGLYYSDIGLSFASAGFQAAANFATPDNGVTPAFVLSNGFPNSLSLTPTQNPSILNGQNADFLSSNATAMPRVQEWSLNLQRELPGKSVVEVTYIGNKGTRLLDSQMSNRNQLDPQYLSLGSLLTQNITSAAAVAAGIRAPYPGYTGTVAQALRPYPQYRTLTEVGAKEGASSYNALQLTYKKRLSAGFTLDASYVYSRLYGYHAPSGSLTGAVDNVLQNSFNRRAEWSLMPSDVRNAVVLNYVYNLPFRSKQKALNALIGGWTIAAIQRYQSGFPLSILANNSLPIFNRVLRPNEVSGAERSTGISLSNWQQGSSALINRAAFSQPAAFTFGNAQPTYEGLRGFPVLSEDINLSKRISFTEQVAATLYGQFFNIFNRHRFTGIDTNLSNASFGQAGSVSQPRFVQLGVRIQF